MKKCLLLVLTLLMLGCLATADAETAYPTGLVYEIIEGGAYYRFPLNEIVATKDGEGVIWPARPDISWTAVTIDEDGVITIPYIDFSVSDANEYIDSFNNYDEQWRFMTNNYPQFWYSGEHREGPLRIQIKGEINGIPAEYNYESINNICFSPFDLGITIARESGVYGPFDVTVSMEDLCYTYKLKLNVTQQSTEFEEGTVLLDQPYYNSPDCSEIYVHGETDTSEPPQLAVMYHGIPIEGTVFVGGKGNTLELDLERSAETTKSATVKLVDVATGETLQELKSASNDYGSALEFVDVQLDKAFPSGEYDLIVTWDGAESISRITLLNPEDAVDAGTAEAAIEGGNEVSFLDAGDIVPFENLIENDVITLQAENEYGEVSFYVPLKDNVEDYLLVLSGKTLQGQDFVKIESLYDWGDGGVATFYIANTVGEFGPYTLKLMGNGKTYTWQIKVQVDQDVAEEYDFRSGVAYNTCAFCVVSKPMQTIQIVFGDAVVGTRVFYGAAGYDLPISIEAYDSETDLLVELINAEGVVVASNTIPQKVLEYDRIEYPITLPEGITSGEYVLSISNGDCTITRKLNLRCDETVIPFNCYGTPDTDRSLNPIKYGLVPEWLSY